MLLSDSWSVIQIRIVDKSIRYISNGKEKTNEQIRIDNHK